jgi:fibronectin type 3 domain-containing protein
VSGGPYTSVASANSGTTFVDGFVQSGQTYYYVVTAVDTGGAESVYSNQVQAIIPSP